MTNFQPSQTGSPVYDQVLAILRSSLWGEERFPYQAPQDVTWKELAKELGQQTVQFLPIDLLARENPGKYQNYVNAAAVNMMRWYKIMQEQQELCQLLSAAGIPCAVVKGAAAAIYYPQPGNRLIGDIDLLVKPSDFEQACRIVSEGADFLSENHRHREYRRNNVVVEIHRSFSSLRDPIKKEHFDQRIFDAIGAAESVSLHNCAFFTLPRIENGLTLLEHLNIHLEEGLGLRQIIDWMMFVDKALPDPVWHSEFAPFLRSIGLETLAVTVTRMCQMYLGLRTDITWCADAEEALCHELMEYIFHQGNFGRKNPRNFNRATSVIASTESPFSFFRILQHRGCQNWKALTRYPFLKPFAWLYQLIRYICRGLRTEHPVQFLQNAINRSKSKSNFLKALGVSTLAEKVQQQK